MEDWVDGFSGTVRTSGEDFLFLDAIGSRQSTILKPLGMIGGGEIATPPKESGMREVFDELVLEG